MLGPVGRPSITQYGRNQPCRCRTGFLTLLLFPGRHRLLGTALQPSFGRAAQVASISPRGGLHTDYSRPDGDSLHTMVTSETVAESRTGSAATRGAGGAEPAPRGGCGAPAGRGPCAGPRRARSPGWRTPRRGTPWPCAAGDPGVPAPRRCPGHARAPGEARQCPTMRFHGQRFARARSLHDCAPPTVEAWLHQHKTTISTKAQPAETC